MRLLSLPDDLHGPAPDRPHPSTRAIADSTRTRGRPPYF